MERSFIYLLFVGMFCDIQAGKHNHKQEDVMDISFLGKEIYGHPSTLTGKRVAKWRPGKGNPEELGNYKEGDILHPIKAQGKSGLTSEVYRWSGGVVPYVINGTFTDAEINLIMSAIDQFHYYTCIQFVPRTDETDYLDVTSELTGCWSSIGRIGRGRQQLNLQRPGCVTVPGTPVHEFMHALGFIHEQSRSERDKYVTIMYANIIESTRSNFAKYPRNIISTFDVPYDYGSVMHYGRTAFSANGQDTIVPKIPGVTLGQRNGLSAKDVQSIRNMYKC